MNFILFLLLGLGIGTLGTIVGAGGGIILIPTLMFLYPEMAPAKITSISLFAIACNATSGSIGYLARKKVHLGSALLFTLGSIPGAWIGATLSSHVERQHFNFLFAALMGAFGLFLFFKKNNPRHDAANQVLNLQKKQLVVGFLISFLVGILASFLGIGGGIVHVPLLSEVLGFPVHLATGTSHFILGLTAITGSIVHYVRGELTFQEPFLPPLILGIIVGAQVGAALSKHVKGTVILRILGGLLILVALRITFL